MELREFPVTRYQGSKRKIVLWIYEAIKELNFHTTVDVFGGTGTVSYLFKKMNKAVTYNDSLKFNHIIGKALIGNQEVTIPENEISLILQHNSENKFITNTFPNIYYLQHENEWLDNVIHGIETLYRISNEENDYKKALAYYALFQSCMIKRPFNLFHRNNLSLRTNDVKRNFGNKTTWEKPFDELFKKFINEGNGLVFNNDQICHSLNQSAFDIDPIGYDLVYLDPPYFAQKGTNETANYLKCYHFLEGIANYNNWSTMIDFETPNLRFINPNTQKDFIEKDIHNKFEELIYKFRNSIIIFSYKKGGIPSIDFIRKTMKKFKQNVYTKSVHYKYALNHQNGDAKNNREVIIVGL